MELLKVYVSLGLVVLWLPASSHALLQHFGFIHQVHAHDDHHDHDDADHHPASEDSHEHGTDNHPAADGLCLIAAGKVQVPIPEVVALTGWVALSFLPPSVDLNCSALHSGLSPPGVAPPELSPRWQFTFRAALPVRAPSFVS